MCIRDSRYIEEPEPDTLSQEDIENNSILLCIATPLTDLLIELDDE